MRLGFAMKKILEPCLFLLNNMRYIFSDYHDLFEFHKEDQCPKPITSAESVLPPYVHFNFLCIELLGYLKSQGCLLRNRRA